VSDAATRADPPNRWPWPPIIFAGAAAAAFLLGRFSPWPDASWATPGLRLFGYALFAAGLTLDGAAMLTMRRCRANILPHRSATALVTSGPFALSRNPIYLGNTVALMAAAAAFGNAWFLPAALGAAKLVSLLAIRREEAHLAALFGPAWSTYAQRTSRWLRVGAARVTMRH